MSRTFRQYIRMVRFNKEKAAAITKIEEKLKAESKARAIAQEKLRVEIATRVAAERQVKAQAEQKLLPDRLFGLVFLRRGNISFVINMLEF